MRGRLIASLQACAAQTAMTHPGCRCQSDLPVHRFCRGGLVALLITLRVCLNRQKRNARASHTCTCEGLPVRGATPAAARPKLPITGLAGVLCRGLKPATRAHQSGWCKRVTAETEGKQGRQHGLGHSPCVQAAVAAAAPVAAGPADVNRELRSRYPQKAIQHHNCAWLLMAKPIHL